MLKEDLRFDSNPELPRLISPEKLVQRAAQRATHPKQLSEVTRGTMNALTLESLLLETRSPWQAPHVRMADEAIGIGPPVALQSYLDPRKILDAVSRTGAQAVHPG